MVPALNAGDIGDSIANCDPWQELDFGAISIEGSRVFWKIDYYDCLLAMRSDDLADPSVTNRVMTIMLAKEY